MKRFLSIILTAAMLMSATPAVFAENNAVDESVIVAEELNFENQEEITEEVAENVTEDVSEEISGEGEENSEEQISLMSGENDISLMAATIENTVDKTADNAAVKVDGINNDWNDYYFSNLQDAVKAINEHPSNSNTARIFITNKAADEISIDKTLSIGSDSVNVSVQIFAQKKCTIKRADDFTGAFFEIFKDSSLTFGNKSQSDSYKTLTLDGDKANVTAKAPLIISSGKLVFNLDIVLQNNKNVDTYAYGGAIYIDSSGSFEMKNGAIENNECTGYVAGGGAVTSEGNVTISGGTIINNTVATSGGLADGDSILFAGDVLTITGGTIKSSDESKNDIFLQSMADTDWVNKKTTVYDSMLAVSGSPVLGAIVLECENLLASSKDGDGNVTWQEEYSTRPYIKVDGSLGEDTTIAIAGRYSDYKSDTWRSELIPGIQLVKFADGINPQGYISKFKYVGESKLYFNVDNQGGLSLSDTAAGHAVTVQDPIYMAATFEGWPDSKIGTIKVTGADNLDSVSEGTELTLAFDIADDSNAKNHSFVKWVVTTENGSEVSVTDNKFTMPGEAVTVTAEFVPNITMTFYVGQTSSSNECEDYTWNEDGTITYTMPNGEGTLTISTPNGFKKKIKYSGETNEPTVTASDVVTVTVNTNDGYIFNGISSVTSQQGNLTGTINNNPGTYTFSIPDGTYAQYVNYPNAYIILNITKQQYNITKNYDSSMGKVEVVLSSNTSTEITKAYSNSSIRIDIKPKENYKIKTVKVTDKNNQDVTLNQENVKQYTFTMPASDVAVTVEFELDACGITIDPCEHGSVTTNPSGTATVGSEVTITAMPDTNYELDTLTVTTASGATVTVADNKFTMPSESVTIKAVFVKSKFDVTVEETENGMVSCDEKDKKVDWGTEIDFTVKPNDYYDIDTVTVNGNEVTPDADGNYKFTSKAENSTIKATFKKQQFALTDATTETNGTVSIMSGSTDVNKQKLDWGTSVTVTVAPKDNWEIDKVTINGKDISEFKDTVLHTMSLLSANAPTTYTVLIPTYDAELVVTYKKQQFSVTASSTTNGKISLLTDSPLNWGENFTINVQAAPHYEIDTVIVDGKAVSVNEQGDYTFEMPTHDVIVSATFKKKAYNITISGEHFTVVGNPGKSVWGETVTIKLNAEQWYNYDIFTVTPDTVLTGGNGTWVFTMPQSDITIDIKMVRPKFNITFESNGGSSVDGQAIENGNTVAKPSTPTYVNHGFAGWYTSSTFEADTKYDFSTNVTGNVTLYARWFLWGDVNGDGEVESDDAFLIRYCEVGAREYSTLKNWIAGCVNGFSNDAVRNPDSSDAFSIRRYSVGASNRFKVENNSYEIDLENNQIIK